MTETPTREEVEALASECAVYRETMPEGEPGYDALLDLVHRSEAIIRSLSTPDEVNALLGAAYEAAHAHFDVDDLDGVETARMCKYAQKEIRVLTPTDAREALDRAIAEAVEKERERCSKVAETAYRDTAFFLTMHEHGTYNAAVSQIAAAIREGKE